MTKTTLGGLVVCPHCGTHVPDDAIICPACRSDINSTMSMGRLEGTFCPSCGTLVMEDDETCPNCGMPVEHVQHGSPDAPPVLERPAIETDVAPRFESAIPSPPNPTEGIKLKPGVEPPAHRFIFAVALSVVVVGGAMALITHPWDPTRHDERATQEVDTSKAGFPGERDVLTGQDSNPDAETEVQSVDEYTYERLSEAYASLDKYHDELAKSEESLRKAAHDKDVATYEEGLATVEQLSYDISNLLADVGQLDVSSGVYAEDLEHVKSLGNWLRNWCDMLVMGWTYASSDPAPAEDEVLQVLSEDEQEPGINTYRAMFEESYDGWKVVEHVAE